MNRKEKTHFDVRKLTEAVRLYELRNGTLDDTLAVADALKAERDLEARAIRRGLYLDRQYSLTPADTDVPVKHKVSPLAILLIVSVIAGVMAGRTIGAGSPSLTNAMAWIGGILVVQAVGIILWLASFRVQFEGWRSMFPWLKDWAAGFFKETSFDALLLQAQLILDEKNDLSRWRVGKTVHGAWIVVYFSMGMTVLWLFAHYQHDPELPSTIFGEGYFGFLVRSLGTVPSYLGFPLPTEADIRQAMSRVPGSEATRRVWGWWILGALAVWGLVPRLILWAICAAVVAGREAGAKLDLTNPYYANLRASLLPSDDQSVVVDSAPAHTSATSGDIHDQRLEGLPVILGFQITDGRWPPRLPVGVVDAGVILGPDDQRRARDLLDNQKPARLLIACDSELSPDRGSLRLIADYMARSGSTSVLLTSPRERADAVRRSLWKSALLERGVDEANVFTDEVEALQWLKNPQAQS